jgi:hypothetical protein
MTVAESSTSTALPDECYRCGYDLRGVSDDQPCTECGLLAARSRRPTDELHETRPGWLRRLSFGVWLILLGLAMLVAWPYLTFVFRFNGPVQNATGYAFKAHMIWAGADLAAMLFVTGIVLLTSVEGYEPADQQDRWRRRWLRLAALPPIIALAITHVTTQYQVSAMTAWMAGRRNYVNTPSEFLAMIVFLLLTIGLVPLPLLLMVQLRSLAKRARNADLAEHCVIVGVGNTITLIYGPILRWIINSPETFGLSPNWYNRSTIALVMVGTLIALSLLFALWNVYLLVRFAIAFGSASRKLRRQWHRDDRAKPVMAA